MEDAAGAPLARVGELAPDAPACDDASPVPPAHAPSVSTAVRVAAESSRVVGTRPRYVRAYARRVRVLSLEHWQALERAHEERVDELTAGHRERRRRGVKHPVEDFLFEYYPNSVGKLRRWHPGAGIVLACAAGMPRTQWRHYRTAGCDERSAPGGGTEGVGTEGVCVDVEGFMARRGAALRAAYRLVSATLARPAQLGCFGLHEWAMVYRLDPGEVRHTAWPLRLGADGTDRVVESQTLRCSHVDAFRFFTAQARPRNALQPTRATQAELEQPGCLHAGMDLYKWCYSLAPIVPSRLTLEAFELAREIRTLDMQASPYDLTALGYEPVPIETRAGRQTYVDAQRLFMERSNALRRKLVRVLEPLA